MNHAFRISHTTVRPLPPPAKSREVASLQFGLAEACGLRQFMKSHLNLEFESLNTWLLVLRTTAGLIGANPSHVGYCGSKRNYTVFRSTLSTV